MNRGFIDGNSQVAVACMDIFLALNGVRLEAGRDEAIAFNYRTTKPAPCTSQCWRNG